MKSRYTPAQFFPTFHTWVQFSGKGETIFEGDMRRGREEVFTDAAFFVCRFVV